MATHWTPTSVTPGLVIKAAAASARTMSVSRRASGGAIARERTCSPKRWCPELYARAASGELSERIMDLVTQWPGGPRHLIDVTIRSPFAKDGSKGAAAGRATVLAARDKVAKYGTSIWTLVVEPGGRIGTEGQM